MVLDDDRALANQSFGIPRTKLGAAEGCDSCLHLDVMSADTDIREDKEERIRVERSQHQLDFFECQNTAGCIGVEDRRRCGVVIVVHGRADAQALRNAVRNAQETAQSGMLEQLHEAFGNTGKRAQALGVNSAETRA